MRPNQTRIRLLTSAALVTLLALPAGGCKTVGLTETTGSIGQTPRSESEWRQEAEVWKERYTKNPADAEAAYGYAQALRATGQRSQTVAVLEQATIHNPKNTMLLGAYGRALAATGAYARALEVLNRSHTPDQPDWRILSVQGAVLDQMGRHDDARRYYANALKIAPDEPSVLSNLGLSYALSKDLPKAEETLRQASASKSSDQRVRQNLALVVGLQGRYAEAETIARGDLSPEEASASVAYLRQMIEQERGRKKGKNAPSPLKDAAAQS
jgi:Flp pilus assembly protein TadD